VFARYGYFTGEGQPPPELIADGHLERAQNAAKRGEWHEFLVYDPGLQKFVFDDRGSTPLKRRRQLVADAEAALPVLFGEARRAGNADRQLKRDAVDQAAELVEVLAKGVDSEKARRRARRKRRRAKARKATKALD
jgi:hypothetical protein